MASPTGDPFINHHHDYSSTITNQQQQGHGLDGGDVGSPTILFSNIIPVIGFGSSSSPDPTQPNHGSQSAPTSAHEVQPSLTTLPFTSSSWGGNVCHVIYNDLIPPPPPPPFIPPAATNFMCSSKSKRGLPRDEYSSGDGESSSSTPLKLLRGDHEKPPIKCVVCGREFTRDKAYFGHLRKHPDRKWRGAYPPLEVRKLGPTLSELANQTIARMNERSGPSSSTSYSSSMSSLGINLNNPPLSRSADDGSPLPFDLNKPPPPENEEEEEEDPDNGHRSNKPADI